jgi:hypothetical protein
MATETQDSTLTGHAAIAEAERTGRSLKLPVDPTTGAYVLPDEDTED